MGGPEDRSSIIIFAEGVQQVTQGLLGAKDPKLMQAVSSLQKPQGGTALWDGIGAALAQLHHGSSRGRDDWIICVTDGEDNRSRQHAPHQLQQMIHQMGTNVIILSVGVTKPTAHVDMATVVGNAASGCIGEKIDMTAVQKSTRRSARSRR